MLDLTRAGLRGWGRLLPVAMMVMMLVGCASTSRRTASTTGTGTGSDPDRQGQPSVQRGLASWYASGTMTASGERFDPRGMTAAHRTLPFGSRVRVTHERSGRAVIVRINDRGPFGNKRRIIDLSKGAAARLGIIDAGVAKVRVEVIARPPARRARRR